MPKTRPFVIISPDEMNRYCADDRDRSYDQRLKSYPTRVPVRHGRGKGWVVLDQIRTIDRRRIIKIWTTLRERKSSP